LPEKNENVNQDKIFKGLDFSTDFTVEDWNALIKLKFKKYIPNENLIEQNKEVLRTEIVNYIRVSVKNEYLELFEWTLKIFADCIIFNKEETINIISESFDEICNTDYKWMTNVLTQPNFAEFSERDKITFYFKIIDETLEGVFKPRFKLFDKLTNFLITQNIIDNSNYDFGKIISDFPKQYEIDAKLFLKDPIHSISTSQWRNISAHKSFTINKENIKVEYGKTNKKTVFIQFEDFYKIVFWTQDIYRVIRLSQVITCLNYMKEIVGNIGDSEKSNHRFESSLLNLVHNMQIVGFEFISTEIENETFCLKLKGKKEHDLKSSLIHASQCLDQLSCAIYDDVFIRDNYNKTKIIIFNEHTNEIGSATIPIDVALKKVKSEINMDEYLNNMEFEIKNNA
jgi:hypothetical protein